MAKTGSITSAFSSFFVVEFEAGVAVAVATAEAVAVGAGAAVGAVGAAVGAAVEASAALSGAPVAGVAVRSSRGVGAGVAEQAPIKNPKISATEWRDWLTGA